MSRASDIAERKNNELSPCSKESLCLKDYLTGMSNRFDEYFLSIFILNTQNI